MEQMLRLRMGSGLKRLLETLVKNCHSDFVGVVSLCAEIVKSSSEGAWNSFQGSQLAEEKSFRDYHLGLL
jgi:hypothetical protein